MLESDIQLRLNTCFLIDGPPTEQEYLVTGILPLAVCALIVGAPKNKKTWLAHAIAIAVANGGLVLDKWKAVKQGKVLIYSPEGGMQNLKRRLWGLCWAQDLNPIEILKHIPIIEDRISISDDEKLSLLEATIGHYEPLLFIADPLVGCHGAKENSSDEMQPVLDRFRDLGKVNAGMTTLIVHHVPKGGHGPRGSSAIDGWWDTKLEVTGSADDDHLQGITFDHRDGLPPAPIGYRLVAGLPDDKWEAPKGLYTYDLQAEDFPGTGKTGQNLDIETVSRVLRMIDTSQEPLSRAQGATLMEMTRSKFNRYFDHLKGQGKVRLISDGQKQVMKCT